MVKLEMLLAFDVLLLPTFWLGASAHHLRFGATLDLQLSQHIAALKDIARYQMKRFEEIILRQWR
jgi:creatinine amidohydrolase/Fe(II)-dependent formamide hydrolase-like protein